MCPLAFRDNGVTVETERRAFLVLRKRRTVIELFRRAQRKGNAVLAVHLDGARADRVPFAALVQENVRRVLFRAAHLRRNAVVEGEDFANAVEVSFRAMDGPFARPVQHIFPQEMPQLFLKSFVHMHHNYIIFTCHRSLPTWHESTGVGRASTLHDPEKQQNQRRKERPSCPSQSYAQSSRVA